MGEDGASEQQIQTWADEAAAGYDAQELQRRGRGRPGRGAEPMQVVTVRLTTDELAALDATTCHGRKRSGKHWLCQVNGATGCGGELDVGANGAHSA